jgi:amidase
VVDPVILGPTEGLDAAEMTVLLSEFKADLAAWLAGQGAPNGLRDLDDIILYDAANRDEIMPWFAQELFEQAAAAGSLSDSTYRAALATGRRLARGAIEGALRRDRLDLLIAPSNGPAWTIDLLNGDNFAGGVSSSTLPAVAGWPALSVPMCQAWGLPLGLTFFGGALEEPALLRAAQAYEAARGPLPPPAFQRRELE